MPIFADEITAPQNTTWAYVALMALIFLGKCLDEFRQWQTRRRDQKAEEMRAAALKQSILAAETAKDARDQAEKTAVALAEKTEAVAARLETKTEEVAERLERKTDIQTNAINLKTESIHELVNGGMGSIKQAIVDANKASKG